MANEKNLLKSEGRFGKYILAEKVGQGGWGEVWLATNAWIPNKPPVAIKFVLRQRSQKELERFEHEVAILGKLWGHPNIITADDYGEQNGIPYLVMEYAPNGDLARRIAQGLSLELVADYLDQISNGLDYVHSQKPHPIIHRDLKPSNILFGVNDVLKLADFGIAHDEDVTLTYTGMNLGTPEYMAPEQFTDPREVTPAADIYSLGIITFQMLTQQLPFGFRIKGEVSAGDVEMGHRHKPVPDLKKLRYGLPSGLQDVLETALHKNPEERFPSAGDLARRFREELGKAPLILPTEFYSQSEAQIAEENRFKQLEGLVQSFKVVEEDFREQFQLVWDMVNTQEGSAETLKELFELRLQAIREKLEGFNRYIADCEAIIAQVPTDSDSSLEREKLEARAQELRQSLAQNEEQIGKAENIAQLRVERQLEAEQLEQRVAERVQQGAELKRQFEAAEMGFEFQWAEASQLLELSTSYSPALEPEFEQKLAQLEATSHPIEALLSAFAVLLSQCESEEERTRLEAGYPELEGRYKEIQNKLALTRTQFGEKLATLRNEAEAAVRQAEALAKEERAKERAATAELLRRGFESFTTDLLNSLARFEAKVNSATGNPNQLTQAFERELAILSEALKEAESRRGAYAALAPLAESKNEENALSEALVQLDAALSRCRAGYEQAFMAAGQRVEQQQEIDKQFAEEQKRLATEEQRLGEEAATTRGLVEAALKNFQLAIEKTVGQSNELKEAYGKEEKRIAGLIAQLEQLSSGYEKLTQQAPEPAQKQRLNQQTSDLHRAWRNYQQEFETLSGKAAVVVKGAAEYEQRQQEEAEAKRQQQQATAARATRAAEIKRAFEQTEQSFQRQRQAVEQMLKNSQGSAEKVKQDFAAKKAELEGLLKKLEANLTAVNELAQQAATAEEKSAFERERQQLKARVQGYREQLEALGQLHQATVDRLKTPPVPVTKPLIPPTEPLTPALKTEPLTALKPNIAGNGAVKAPHKRLKVFLCHSSKDKPQVLELYKKLKTVSWIEPWLDRENLIGGQDWQLEIRRAVEASDVVIVVLSNEAVTKAGFVHKEIAYALDMAELQPEGAIFIVPTKVEECKIPDRLSRWHWVELFQKDGYGRLLRALSKRAEDLGLFDEPKPPKPIKNNKIWWSAGSLLAIATISVLFALNLLGGTPQTPSLATATVAATAATTATDTTTATVLPTATISATPTVATTVSITTIAPTATVITPSPTPGSSLALFGTGTTRRGDLTQVTTADVVTSFSEGEEIFAYLNFDGARPGVDEIGVILIANGNPVSENKYTLQKKSGFVLFSLGKQGAGTFRVQFRYNGAIIADWQPDFRVTAVTTTNSAPVVVVNTPRTTTVFVPTTAAPVPPTPTPIQPTAIPQGIPTPTFCPPGSC